MEENKVNPISSNTTSKLDPPEFVSHVPVISHQTAGRKRNRNSIILIIVVIRVKV